MTQQDLIISRLTEMREKLRKFQLEHADILKSMTWRKHSVHGEIDGIDDCFGEALTVADWYWNGEPQDEHDAKWDRLAGDAEAHSDARGER